MSKAAFKQLCSEHMCVCHRTQVVVYLQPRLSLPVRVYLCGQPGTPNLRMFPEVVEASSTLANIQELLQLRQLTCMAFPAEEHSASIPSAQQQQQQEQQQPAQACSSSTSSGSSSVVVKRQDGSCCSRVCVGQQCTVQELLAALWEVEVSCSGNTSCQGLLSKAPGAVCTAVEASLACPEVPNPKMLASAASCDQHSHE
jgi:hypothetical protein